MLALHDWALVYLILITGACLQGLIGFGLGLFSAPLLFLIAPQLVPVPMILNALVITLALLLANRRYVDKQLAPFSILGGSVGVFLATAVFTLLDLAQYQILFGLSIVCAVLLSVAGFTPRVSGVSSAIAGTLSGFMGTLTSAGGAPMGLLYQTAHQQQIKANLSLFFVYINALSILSLSMADVVNKQDLLLFVYSVPAVIVGYVLSLFFRRYLNLNVIRPLILFIAFCSGLVCIFA
ncbi:hypothetical protein AX660_16765 [Paraglaciecola hydrolytica]|uniref:Probable membrane transporter protein n=1 Tax=Paraglaciecola hydrolytica TaxID=1799789 RepID=A0A135ZZH6_9ALTE|nr:hypothetical protein AX660_16765 [Paraglaciecola hydrolytica]